MIAYIKGKIKAKRERSLLVLVDNIGYQVNVSELLITQYRIGETLELYTRMTVSSRDETRELYGFSSADELDFFERLLSISGVGPRSALAVLSVAKLEDLQRTIAQGDASLLQQVSGIGKKTAERIIIELRDKLSDLAVTGESDAELISALQNLGYTMLDIRAILRQLPPDLSDSAAKVKTALKLLGK